jgi:hypothetical protein
LAFSITQSPDNSVPFNARLCEERWALNLSHLQGIKVQCYCNSLGHAQKSNKIAEFEINFGFEFRGIGNLSLLLCSSYDEMMALSMKAI